MKLSLLTTPLLYESHCHTPLCHHASGEPTEYAARAVALGLTEIGFSDHAPMRRDNFDNWRMNGGPTQFRTNLGALTAPRSNTSALREQFPVEHPQSARSRVALVADLQFEPDNGSGRADVSNGSCHCSVGTRLPAPRTATCNSS